MRLRERELHSGLILWPLKSLALATSSSPAPLRHRNRLGVANRDMRHRPPARRLPHTSRSPAWRALQRYVLRCALRRHIFAAAACSEPSHIRVQVKDGLCIYGTCPRIHVLISLTDWLVQSRPSREYQWPATKAIASRHGQAHKRGPTRAARPGTRTGPMLCALRNPHPACPGRVELAPSRRAARRAVCTFSSDPPECAQSGFPPRTPHDAARQSPEMSKSMYRPCLPEHT